MAASLSARPRSCLLQFLIARPFCRSRYSQVSVAPSSVEHKGPSKVTAQEIVIPKKKKRDSLTVLKALASVVKRDPGAPHYKYTDDPYLIPTSNLAKKSYALSKESGRKAARYVLEQHAQWFNKDPAEPSVPLLNPPKVAYKYIDPTEAALLERIEKRRVKDAVEVYKNIQIDKKVVSEDSKRKFLELLCLYNSQDPPMSLLPEEQFFDREMGKDLRRPAKTWKEGGMAERVYDELKEKTSEDQQNLIRGMARHLETEKAYAMYNEMMDKKMPVDAVTFNELIRVATFHHDTYETKWKQVESLLMDMKLLGIKPDITIFNSVLYSLSRIPNYHRSPSIALQTLNEMKALGIEPSLASWRHMLIVFYPNDSVESNMLYKIIDYLEGKEFTVQDADDMEFFVNAMRRCSNNLHDVELAYRIDKLTNTGNNSAFLGDSRTENMYYALFLHLVCTFETLDKIMEVYHHVTPHLWTPTLGVLEDLLKAIELQDGYQHIPVLWMDINLFDFQRRTELLEKPLEVMAKKKYEPQLQAQFAQISSQFFERWQEDREDGKQPALSTGKMVGHLITVSSNAGDHDLAWKLFTTYREHKNLFTGSPNDEALQALVMACLEAGDAEKAVTVVQLMDSLEMPGASAAARLIIDSQNVELSQAQRVMLANL